MKQRLKSYSKRKPFKMKQGGAKFMLRSVGVQSKRSIPPELNIKNLLTNFFDSMFNHKRIRSSIKQKNKEITKES